MTVIYLNFENLRNRRTLVTLVFASVSSWFSYWLKVLLPTLHFFLPNAVPAVYERSLLYYHWTPIFEENVHVEGLKSSWNIAPRYLIKNYKENVIIRNNFDNDCRLSETFDSRWFVHWNMPMSRWKEMFKYLSAKNESWLFRTEITLQWEINDSDTMIVWLNSICDEHIAKYSLESENISSKSNCTKDLLCNVY